jgi:thymidylate kinase
VATMMAREAWTDERLDDLNKRVDDGFKRVDESFKEVREEFRAVRIETNQRFNELHRLMVQMFGSMMLGFVGIIVTILMHG